MQKKVVFGGANDVDICCLAHSLGQTYVVAPWWWRRQQQQHQHQQQQQHQDTDSITGWLCKNPAGTFLCLSTYHRVIHIPVCEVCSHLKVGNTDPVMYGKSITEYCKVDVFSSVQGCLKLQDNESGTLDCNTGSGVIHHQRSRINRCSPETLPWTLIVDHPVVVRGGKSSIKMPTSSKNSPNPLKKEKFGD